MKTIKQRIIDFLMLFNGKNMPDYSRCESKS